MYKCDDCEIMFDEPEKKKINFEEIYGVSNLFPNSTRTTILVCPNCESDQIDELSQCENCEEWFKTEDLEDTTEYINGGIGYCCSQCIVDLEMVEI